MSHVDTASFEERFRRDPDPWDFATSFYEIRRYAVIVAALPRFRFRHAFEPACANGDLTRRLADRCDAVTALDCSATAVARARARCAGRPGVTIRLGELPGDWPCERFDLVVLSELGYYFDRAELADLRERAVASLPVGGHLIAVHWLGTSEDHLLSGDDVHRVLHAGVRLTPIAAYRDVRFRLDLWERG
jgi:predicted TPR repeat methyltransferase